MKAPLLKTLGNCMAIALMILALGACSQKQASTVERIEKLQKQVNADAKTLQQIENEDYTNLSKDFLFCDSLLQYMDTAQVNRCFEQLNLTHAYLKQFDGVKADMQKKAAYSNLQLDHLKADLESQYISDSLACVYLEVETKVADTLHNRVLYFQDRFAQCKKELASIKKACH